MGPNNFHGSELQGQVKQQKWYEKADYMDESWDVRRSRV